MFKQPQHEHRSTGIASGLEYRDGYAVGGRVGFKNGKLVVNEAALDNAMSSFNPNVSIGAGPNLDLPSATTKDSGIDLDKNGVLAYEAVKLLRSTIGRKLSEINLVPDVDKAQLKLIYGA